MQIKRYIRTVLLFPRRPFACICYCNHISSSQQEMASALHFIVLLCGLWIGANVIHARRSGFSRAHTVSALSTQRVITCDDANNVHRLSCDQGLIIVQSAMYGRQNRETCSYGRPLSQLSNINCALRSTLDKVKRSCDGKKVCEINTNPFRALDPCRGIYKYLESTYACFPATRVIACEHSFAHLQCDEGQVISVYSANYGRRDRTTCSYGHLAHVQNVHCSHPTNHVAQSCNGRSSCAVRASNSIFGEPCNGIYKYLEVFYTCQDAEEK